MLYAINSYVLTCFSYFAARKNSIKSFARKKFLKSAEDEFQRIGVEHIDAIIHQNSGIVRDCQVSIAISSTLRAMISLAFGVVEENIVQEVSKDLSFQLFFATKNQLPYWRYFPSRQFKRVKESVQRMKGHMNDITLLRAASPHPCIMDIYNNLVQEGKMTQEEAEWDLFIYFTGKKPCN